LVCHVIVIEKKKDNIISEIEWNFRPCLVFLVT
jgi:hypothetical protein